MAILLAPSVFAAAMAVSAVVDVLAVFDPRREVRERVWENAAVASKRMQMGTMSFFIINSSGLRLLRPSLRQSVNASQVA
jgi:hypothetical protein